ncbi:MAG: pyrimidine 5'-nucleotidase [Alphaproteobacteria bacterium]|nr:pyrimidine 5'-nucleotidase [Alphaproteobacteria bacterium]
MNEESARATNDSPPGRETADPDDLRAAHTWIFDLDNTLYPSSCNLFAQIDVRMGAFVSELLDLPRDEARTLQKQYFRDHGTTLNGLMMNHGIDPGDFLDFVHDIDYAPVAHDLRLETALDRLPGRKLIFTNGTVKHAEAVLERLAIADRFDAIYDIVASDYVPKPNPDPYDKLLVEHEIDPVGAVMVEDMAKNLRHPAALGMATVWVMTEAVWAHPQEGDDDHIHHRTNDLAAWLDALTQA